MSLSPSLFSRSLFFLDVYFSMSISPDVCFSYYKWLNDNPQQLSYVSLTCLDNRAEIVRDDVKGDHWIALLDEVFGHVPSHVPQPDETHGILPMCAAGDCKTEDQDIKFHVSTLFK